MLSQLTKHIVLQKNNGKTKKKQHARLPAQVPASSVSKSPRWQHRQDGKDAVSGQKTGNIKQTTAWAKQEREEEKGGGQYGLPQRVGGKRQWCLGSEEPIVPSHAWQNDGKFRHSATCCQ